MRKLDVLFCVLLLISIAQVSQAAQFNSVSLRATVSANYPDCVFCWASPGCLLEVGTNGTSSGGDPFILALASFPDCSSIQPGDCIEATGEAVQGLLVTGLAVSSYQVSIATWSVVSAGLCQP